MAELQEVVEAGRSGDETAKKEAHIYYHSTLI